MLKCTKVISLSDIFISPLEDMYDMLPKILPLFAMLMHGISYYLVIS